MIFRIFKPAVVFFAVCIFSSASLFARDYPNLNTPPILPARNLESIVSLDQPPGNIAVTPEGRIFFTLHPEGNPSGPKLFEIKNGMPAPFPDASSQENLFHSVLGLAVDARNQLWAIDSGGNGFHAPHLFAFDLAANKLILDYEFPRAIGPIGSYFNDLRVSPDGKAVYIADISFLRRRPAIVVYDAESKMARRVLENDSSVKAGNWTVRSGTRKIIFFGMIKLKLAVDGIALDRKGEWLYYAAMNSDSLYRVRTSDLQDVSLSKEDLSKKVERYSSKPLCDGIEIDEAGNLYAGDVENGSIFRINQERKPETLIQSPRIRWPDGLAAQGGFLYFTDSDLGRVMLKSKKTILSEAPFHIYRVRLAENAAAQ